MRSRLTYTILRACLHEGGGPQVGKVTRLAVVENKTRLHTILQPRGSGVRFLEVDIALAIKELEQRCPKLTSRERRKINSRTHVFIHESVTRCITRC